MQLLRGLGFHPPAGAATTVTNAGVDDPDVAKAIPEGACTSDGKLVWTYTILPQGVWQIVSPTEKCNSNNTTNIDSNDILQGNGVYADMEIYVGGFPISRDNIIKNNTWTISMYDAPAQLPKQVLSWLVANIDAVNGYKKAQNLAWRNFSLTSADMVDGGPPPPCGQYKAYPGAPLPCSTVACNDMFAQASLAGTSPSYTLGPPNLQPLPTDATPITQWWSGNDEHGFLAHFAKYKNDPNTFKFYSFCDWFNAIGGPTWNPCLAAGSTNKGPCFPTMDMARLFKLFDQYWQPGVLGALGAKGAAWDLQASEPPIGKFIHPITGKTWGLWASLYPNPNPCHDPDNCAPAIGYWNSSTDAPNSVSLQIGLRELPDPGWWNQLWGDVFTGLRWIGSALAAVAQGIGDALGDLLKSLACASDAASIAQVNTLIKTNPEAAAALAALRLACPPPAGTPATICPNGAVVVAGQPCPPPWYLQWYTLALAAGVVAVGAVHLARSKS